MSSSSKRGALFTVFSLSLSLSLFLSFSLSLSLSLSLFQFKTHIFNFLIFFQDPTESSCQQRCGICQGHESGRAAPVSRPLRAEVSPGEAEERVSRGGRGIRQRGRDLLPSATRIPGRRQRGALQAADLKVPAPGPCIDRPAIAFFLFFLAPSPFFFSQSLLKIEKQRHVLFIH